MSVSNKDFEAIAKAIREARLNGEESMLGANWLIYALCHYFEERNPQFDRERFMEDCK